MADLIHVNRNGLPWRPTEDSVVTDEFERWDAPMLGIVKQNGTLHLFYRLVGDLDAYSLWVYAPISSAEADDLRAGEGSDFDEAIDGATSGRYLQVALYDGDRGVLLSQVSPGATTAGVWSAATHELLDGVLDSLIAELQADVEALRNGRQLTSSM